MPLQIETRQVGSITILRLSGCILGQNGALALQHSLKQHFEQAEHSILLEVRNVPEIDGAGVDTLRAVQSEAKKAGGDLKLAGARATFLAALALYDSERLFPYYGNTEEALSSFDDKQGSGAGGVKHFDILEFVKEQEREEQEQVSSSESAG